MDKVAGHGLTLLSPAVLGLLSTGGAESFFFLVLGFELRAYTLSHSTSLFIVLGIFKIGSCELFTLAGFEPQSSRSLPPE
jgi:hypothetical protein